MTKHTRPEPQVEFVCVPFSFDSPESETIARADYDPTTENRRCAHRSWTGGWEDSFMALLSFAISRSRSERTLGGGRIERSAHLLRVARAPPPPLT